MSGWSEAKSYCQLETYHLVANHPSLDPLHQIIISYSRERRKGETEEGMGNIMKVICEGFKVEDWTLFA